MELSSNSSSIFGAFSMIMLISVSVLQGSHRPHPEMIGIGSDDMDSLLKGEFDLEAQSVESNNVDGSK